MVTAASDRPLPKNDSPSRSLYVLDLPRLPEYLACPSLPRVGSTSATSSAHAVSEYVFRHVSPESLARQVTAYLRDHSGGYEHHAIVVPQVFSADGLSLYSLGHVRCRTLALAQELACSRGGNPKYHLARASDLINRLQEQGVRL